MLIRPAMTVAIARLTDRLLLVCYLLSPRGQTRPAVCAFLGPAGDQALRRPAPAARYPRFPAACQRHEHATARPRQVLQLLDGARMSCSSSPATAFDTRRLALSVSRVIGRPVRCR